MTSTGSGSVSDVDATIPPSCRMKNIPAIALNGPSSTIGSSPNETIVVPPKANGGKPMWNVPNFKSLPRIPPFYVLEGTRVSVRSVSPTLLADRITSCLKDLSLDASYDDENATALVVSADQVQFFVRLFQDNNGAGDSIVVEIQKKFGCSFRFHKRARSILRVAEGKPCAGTTAGRVRMCKRIPRPALIPRDTKQRNVESGVEEKDIDLALESADCLLKKDRIDANILGMESLVLMTDEETTSSDKALYAARVILRGFKFEDVKAKIQACLQPDVAKDDDLDSLDLQHGEVMHLQALTVLANSLCLVGKDSEELCSILSTDDWVGEDCLLSTLMTELTDSQSTPHCAYQAVRSLNALIRASSITRRKAIELGALAVMTVSQNVGHCRHALLAQESDLFMTTLGESK